MSIRFLFDTEGMMTPIENISQHPENDNNGDVDEIVASMRTMGVYRPIYVSTETGHIVAGNHTYVGMLDLGAKYVPVIWLPGLTPAQERRILFLDNQIARNARPDPALRKELVKQIVADVPGKDVDAALIGTGLSRAEYERLIKPPTPLDLSGIGRETLEHRITCPECGHNWARSGGQEVDF
jgi:ParB-like chromosome segregation protein Spo0J